MNKVVKSVLVISAGIVTGNVIGNMINAVYKREQMYHSIVTGFVKSIESSHEYFATKAVDEYDKKCGAYANGIARAYNEAIRSNSNALCEMGYEDICEMRLTDNYNE